MVKVYFKPHEKQLYSIWHSMKQRCYYAKHKGYKNYGERGIKICDAWKQDFNTFYSWAMKTGFDGTKQIDRINVNDDYKPNNCRWVNVFVQGFNKNFKNNYRGVSFKKGRIGNPWQAQVSSNGKTIFIGTFNTELEAAKARNDYIDAHNLENIKNIIVEQHNKFNYNWIIGSIIILLLLLGIFL